MIQSARIHGVLASVFYPPSRKNSNGFRLKAGVETRSFPALARCYPRSFTLITRTARVRVSYLAALPSTRAIETRSLPSLARCYLCSFTFYVADPSAPFRLSRDIRRSVVYLYRPWLAGGTIPFILRYSMSCP